MAEKIAKILDLSIEQAKKVTQRTLGDDGSLTLKNISFVPRAFTISMYSFFAGLPSKKNFANSTPSKSHVSQEPKFKYFTLCMVD